MLEMLRSFVRRGQTSEVIHECRDCGTAVEEDAGSCSSCGSADIARYEID